MMYVHLNYYVNIMCEYKSTYYIDTVVSSVDNHSEHFDQAGKNRKVHHPIYF